MVAEPEVSDARSVILDRIASSLVDVAGAGTEPAPPAHERVKRDDLGSLFSDRVTDYRANVTRCSAAGVADAVTAICERHSAHRLVTPAKLSHSWIPAGIERIVDQPPLDVSGLDAVDGVITGSAAAVAETGTVILDGGPESGRRALSLVPDLHICVVREDDILPDVPEALAAIKDAAASGQPITLISGPSATSDIELERVEGVHGPRRLEVLLVAA